MFAGSCSVGHVLLGPGDVDLDSIVNLLHSFRVVVTFNVDSPHSNDFLSCVVFTSTSDVSQSLGPLGRSMFTMTPTSDHTLFIYGGLCAYGTTLSKSGFLLSEILTSRTDYEQKWITTLNKEY